MLGLRYALGLGRARDLQDNERSSDYLHFEGLCFFYRPWEVCKLCRILMWDCRHRL
ncbi:unnamed protein product [Prunus brigantina]